MWSSFSNQSYAENSARVVESSRDVLGAWSPDQHLYIKGNLRVGKSSLDGLEKWLDKNGKNWTVLLMERANGETWKDARGANYYGMDAVENALGRGLGNKQEFASQKDVRTGQSNGAVFILFLHERKFSYFGSDVYDRRGLGESAWAGNLDGPARNAMRSGGRIVDAVKNTVTHIEGRLSKRLAYEQRLRTESKNRRERLQRMTQREISDARREISELETEVGKFRARAEVRSGDLASPPLPEWLRELDAAADALKDGHVETASGAVKSVRQKNRKHHEALQAWLHDRESLKNMEQRIKQTQLVDDIPEGRKMLGHAVGFYNESVSAHGRGQSAYADQLRKSTVLLNELDAANDRAMGESKQREQREAQRAEKMKKLTAVGGMAGGVGVFALGLGAYRHRRKTKQHAEAVFKQWQEEMSERVDRLFSVLDRAGVIVGSERDLPERGYEGETLSESIHAIRAVDKAFILSSGVDDVLERVEVLIFPKWLGPKLVNVFSRLRYDQALELLERKPVVLGEGEIKVVDRREDSLLGDHAKENSESTPLAFVDLIHRFDMTLDSADAALERVDNAWETIAERTSDLGMALSRIANSEDDVRAQSLTDGWLAAEILFAKWHPSARTLHQEGIARGRHDPVAALAGPIPRSETMAVEMQFTLDAIKTFRSVKMDAMRENTQLIRRLGRNANWVSEAMQVFSSDLDALAEVGMQSGVQGECEMFRDGLQDLSGRVAFARELSQQSKEEVPKLSKTVRRKVDDTRGRISRELNLDRLDLLTELDEWNPDLILRQSEELKRTAETSLDHGAVELAEEALQSARDAIALADQLVVETLMAYEEFKKRYANGRELVVAAEQLRSDGATILESLRGRYAEASLYYEPMNDSSDTFASSGRTMQESVQSMNQSMVAADDAFRTGGILHARNYLIDTEQSHELVKTLHDGLATRQESLEELANQNTIRMDDSLSSLTGMREALKDSRICDETLGAFSQLEMIVNEGQRVVDAPYGESNPYQAELFLGELDARMSAMETRIRSDREAFAKAEQMLAAADSSALDAGRIVNVSRTDGITDSSVTLELVAKCEACTVALQGCREILETGHSNWRELMKEINSQHTRLGETIAELKDELRRARKAVESIRNARAIVHQAALWSGSYGVRITGSPGASPMQSAHDLLSQGRYDEASRTAAFARTLARQAIASAEAKEATIRSQREAAARRRRRAASSFSSSSSSSFGSSSSSSGFSSSSFSSGSGFSRSGW